ATSPPHSASASRRPASPPPAPTRLRRPPFYEPTEPSFGWFGPLQPEFEQKSCFRVFWVFRQFSLSFCENDQQACRKEGSKLFSTNASCETSAYPSQVHRESITTSTNISISSFTSGCATSRASWYKY
ncbi:hypothetical protein LINPERHAP2_LOCUS7144, partial [Linum perenne]